MKNFGVNWIDLMIAIILVFGVMRGRKRGMSEELLDIIKWAVIVVVAGLCYEPAGMFLAELSVFSLLFSYVFAYSAIALGIVLVFALIRKQVGDKALSSETFGNGEYYLGMMAGGFRYACIILVAMAFLNARHYSPEEIKSAAHYQMDNFGSKFFVTLPDLQREVFDGSTSGRFAQNLLHAVLIKPTAPTDKTLGGDSSVARRREGTLNEILGKK